ncbi:hypothetical protein SAY86_015222 [Trapa natans]|uniref:Glycosyltransferase family 92 protein n=1 Tax=Trapa natans TaxID=22666 RepID=A0AAN7KJJ0_TRANT|nr:hypothetical protein SAY86_015222 [Trapa natans]
MAGHYKYGFSSSSASSSSSYSLSSAAFTSRLLLFLTVLPLTLACFAFILQWRGGITDPMIRWSPDPIGFPGMGSSGGSRGSDGHILLSRSDCVDVLGQSHSASFPYYRDWKFDYSSDLRPKVCITTSTSAGLEQILPWIFYHKVIGVSHFLLFVEGKAASPDVSKVLESIPGIRVIYRTKELEERQARSRIWNESWLASFFYKPCNYELFVKQSLNMEMAIVMARDAGVDWIIHLDTDELIYPAGTREYSLRLLLSEVPANVDMVVFPNYESSVERDDIREPFSEISMFKKNYDHLPKEVYFGNYKEATRGNPNYFLTYGNGKSAARIQDHLRPNGAHRWHNYMKAPNEIKFDEAAVLHYTYPKFSDLTSRRDRCGCKPTKDDVKRCFMLEFDRSAFIIASTASEDEMLQCLNEFSQQEAQSKNLYYQLVQAIVQALRESGVFSSVIASAKTNLSKETFLESIKTANSSKSDSQETSRKIGNSGESQTTAKRILAYMDNADLPAIPPLSPPAPYYFDLE